VISDKSAVVEKACINVLDLPCYRNSWGLEELSNSGSEWMFRPRLPRKNEGLTSEHGLGHVRITWL